MAAVDWPAGLVTIQWGGYGRSREPKAERTRLEDGAVRQQQRVSKPYEVRRMSVAVKLSKLDAFQDWLRVNGNSMFNFHDLDDDTIRDVRLRGGDIDLSAVESLRLDGERYFSGTAEFEGFWS